MQGRVHLGGALSGRDIEAVNKTVSGLVKLLFPDPEMPVSDEDLEWIVRAGARVPTAGQGAAEALLQERVPQHPLQLHPWSPTVLSSSSRRRSCTATKRSRPTRCRPARSGQPAWDRAKAGAGLYRIEVTCGPGGGVKILNQPTPPAFRRASRSASRTSTRGRRSSSATAIRASTSSRSRCAHGRGQDRRRAWVCRCWLRSAVRCWARTRAEARSSSAR